MLDDPAWQVPSFKNMDIRRWTAGSSQASAREGQAALMLATGTEGVLYKMSTAQACLLGTSSNSGVFFFGASLPHTRAATHLSEKPPAVQGSGRT